MTISFSFKNLQAVKTRILTLCMALLMVAMSGSLHAQCTSCPAGAVVITTSQSITLASGTAAVDYCISGAGVVVNFSGTPKNSGATPYFNVYACNGATVNCNSLTHTGSHYFEANGAGTTINLNGDGGANNTMHVAVNGGTINSDGGGSNFIKWKASCYRALVGPSSKIKFDYQASIVSLNSSAFSVYNQGTFEFVATGTNSNGTPYSMNGGPINLYSSTNNWTFCASPNFGPINSNSKATICAGAELGTIGNTSNSPASFTYPTSFCQASSAAANWVTAFTPTATETNCTDGLDNDYDGLVDSADPDCGPACTAPTITTQPVATTNCTGNTMTVVATGSNLTYQWSIGSVSNLATEPGNNTATITLSGSTPAYYLCKVSSGTCVSYTPWTWLSACPAAALTVQTPAAQTATTGGSKSGNAATELAPTGGTSPYTYSNGSSDPACVAPSGATALPASSNLTVNSSTGAYTYTAPATAGTYYFCIKVCDAAATPVCKIATYTVTVTATCAVGAAVPGIK